MLVITCWNSPMHWNWTMLWSYNGRYNYKQGPHYPTNRVHKSSAPTVTRKHLVLEVSFVCKHGCLCLQTFRGITCNKSEVLPSPKFPNYRSRIDLSHFMLYLPGAYLAFFPLTDDSTISMISCNQLVAETKVLVGPEKKTNKQTNKTRLCPLQGHEWS